MTAAPFRLGWFGNLTAPNWRSGWSEDATTWTDARFYVDMVRAMERAGFDFMMLEDSLMVPDIYAGTAELELKHAVYAPKLDPVPVVSMLAYATEHIGIVRVDDVLSAVLAGPRLRDPRPCDARSRGLERGHL